LALLVFFASKQLQHLNTTDSALNQRLDELQLKQMLTQFWVKTNQFKLNLQAYVLPVTHQQCESIEGKGPAIESVNVLQLALLWLFV